MLKKILGLEIGSSNIKLIEVIKNGIYLEVQKFSLIPTPENCITDGVITSMEPISKVISNELKVKGYKAKKVVSVVQSSNIIIRNSTMVKQPEKVIKQLLDVKTEEYLPVQGGQYQIDFKITGEIEECGIIKNKLLLVAAPNMTILPIASLIKNLNLVPYLITIPSEALSHVFNIYSRMIYEDINNVMILDIGAKFTTATIVSNESSILTRTIDFGLEHIKYIINDIDIDNKESGVDDIISNLIRPEIEYNIISEVERILQFYNSSYNNGAVKKIYLIGGGAEIKGIRGYIKDSLNIGVEKLREFDTVKDNSGNNFEHFSRFFVNILGAINGL